MFLKSTLIAAFSLASVAAMADVITPPAVPTNLVVDQGHRPYAIAHATGYQIYTCKPEGEGVKWILFGPQATLFNDAGEQVMTHFLSPNPAQTDHPLRATWQHSSDTSAVWAVMQQESDDPNFVEPGAIKWLKLAVVGAQFDPAAGDYLAKTTFIQRVNTSGGSAPSTGCSVFGDVGKREFVPYTTDYVFYKR